METEDDIVLTTQEYRNLENISIDITNAIYNDLLDNNDVYGLYTVEAVKLANLCGNSYDATEIAQFLQWDMTCPIARGIIGAANIIIGRW